MYIIILCFDFYLSEYCIVKLLPASLKQQEAIEH